MGDHKSFPASFAVGDVTAIASGGEVVLLGLRARHYTAWSNGVPIDGFHLYIADNLFHAWKADTLCPRRHAVRQAAAGTLNLRRDILNVAEVSDG